MCGYAVPAGGAVLTVTLSGTGSGVVASAPAGIDCGSDCLEAFPDNSTVTLQAVAADGSSFDGWSGGECNGKGPCKVKLNGDASVEAVFTSSRAKAKKLIFLTHPGDGITGRLLGAQPVVEVADASGAAVTSDPDPSVVETLTVEFKSGSNQEGAVLSGTLSAAVQWDTGRAVFSDLSVDRAGSYQLTAVTDLGAFTANSNAFSVSPPRLSFITQPGAFSTGHPIPGPTAVAVQDLEGNTLADDDQTVVTVSLKAGSGAPGAVLGGSVNRRVDGGVAVFGDLTIDLVGSDYVLTASAPELAAVESAPFDGTPLLSLAVAAVPNPVQAGGQIVYTLTFSNSSVSETALGVTLTASRPADTTIVAAGNAGTLDPDGGTVRWSLGDLVPGESGTISLVVAVQSPLADGTLISSSAVLSSTAGDRATAEQTVTVQSEALLTLTLGDDVDPVEAGRELIYTLTFGNSSSSNETALGVVLVASLSSQTTFVSAGDGGTLDPDGATVRWPLGELAPGASGTISLVVAVQSPLADGTLISSSAVLESTAGDRATAEQTTTVKSAAALSLAVTDHTDPVEAGREMVYTLTFGNSSASNETAPGVTLTNTIPVHTTFVSASGGGLLEPGGGSVGWFIGDLAPGASGTRTLVVEVHSPLADGTLISNGSVLESAAGDHAAAGQTTTVRSRAVLTLEQSHEPVAVLPGDRVTMTLAFGNSGAANETAHGATLTDTLPAGTTFVTASDAGAPSLSGSTVTWSLGELPPGTEGRRTLVFEIGLSLPSGTILTNSAVLKDGAGRSVPSSRAVILDSPTEETTVEEPGAETDGKDAGDFTLEGTESSVPLVPGPAQSDPVVRLPVLQNTRAAPPTERAWEEEEEKPGARETGLPPLRTRTNERAGVTARCPAGLTVDVVEIFEPLLGADLVTYELSFEHSGAGESAKNALLKSSLPVGMDFTAASDGGREEGGLVVWPLGDIPPGRIGIRTLTLRPALAGPVSSLITTNRAFLESEGFVCAATQHITSVASRPPAAAQIAGAAVDGRTELTGREEAACNASLRDPSAACYRIEIDDRLKTVRRGSRVTFTAHVESEADYEGTVTLRPPDSIAGTLWMLSKSTFALGPRQRSGHASITLQTTKSTPLGLHEASLTAIGGLKASLQTLVFEVVE